MKLHFHDVEKYIAMVILVVFSILQLSWIIQVSKTPVLRSSTISFGDGIKMSKQECDASWFRILQFENCNFGLTLNAGNVSPLYDQCPEDHLAKIDQCALVQPESATKDLGASKFISHPRTREHIGHICQSTRSYLISMISPVSNSNILEAYGTSRGRIYRTFETCVTHWTKYNLLHVQGNAFPPSLDTMPIHLPGLLKPELMLTYRTIPFYIIGKKNPNQDIATTITVATMGSIDKLERLVRLCRSWPDRPVSFVLYTTNVVPDLDTLEAFWTDHALELAHVTVHVFISSAPDAVPLNFLRNLAMEGSSSDYVFALDVDFIPSADTPTELDTLLPELLHDKEKKEARHVALVIPAFQRKYEPNVDVINVPLPQTKSELMKNLGVNISTDMLYTREYPRNYSTSKYQPFHVDYYYKGHGPTGFERWYKATEPYRIQYEDKYEPYVLVNRFLAPRYWEMFRGYGWNKQSWLLEISKLKFRFTVVPRSFLTHVDHNPKGKRTGKVKKQLHLFQKYLRAMYG